MIEENHIFLETGFGNAWDIVKQRDGVFRLTEGENERFVGNYDDIFQAIEAARKLT